MLGRPSLYISTVRPPEHPKLDMPNHLNPENPKVRKPLAHTVSFPGSKPRVYTSSTHDISLSARTQQGYCNVEQPPPTNFRRILYRVIVPGGNHLRLKSMYKFTKPFAAKV